MSEADVHFELYRHLENAIDNEAEREGTSYETVVPEYATGTGGFADLVVFDEAGEPVLVVEAKRPDGSDRRRTDPYAPAVIAQAGQYASEIGAPYFATFNGDRLVLFDTFERGTELLRRSTKSYVIAGLEKFADTLLDEVARFAARDPGWDSLDAAFVERIRSLHELLSPRLASALAQRLEDDDGFRESFVAWTEAQGFDYEGEDDSDQREVRAEFAQQAAYLLVNKIVFYRILEDSETYGGDVRPLTVSTDRIRADFDDHFAEIVDRVDFEAIFEHDPIYDEIPLTTVADRLQEFVRELHELDLTQFDSDVIGRIYEGVIPAERRHELGEYYTPPEICDLLTRLTVDDPDDEVLDPACGSGGFLVSAYNRKRSLFPEPEGTHDRILDQLYGVDINRFPAHLSVINLAIQNLDSYTEHVNVEVNDFFRTGPESLPLDRRRAKATGETTSETVIDDAGEMDVVVGNPPYIRQENIDDKDAVRTHLGAVGGEHLSRRSDIYAYFLTHGTQFLSDGGRLGYVTSDRWLDTKYGADLQRFILDNYRVDAVIKLGKQAFDDALVGSCVFVLTRESAADARADNVVKFLRVNEELDIDQIESVVTEDADPNQMVRRDDYRLVTRRQATLYDEQKWTVFFNAPPVYFDAVADEGFTTLEQVASVSYGEKSGANDFYFGRQKEWEELGLTEYTEPLLKASGQVERIRFDDAVADEWGYLAVHELVERALSETQGYGDVPDERRVLDWLGDNGHENLVEYVRWGRDKGYHERKTTAARDVWFDLGDVDVPPIVMTDFTWREHRVVWNEARAVGSNQFYTIIADDGVSAKLLCGILNSHIAWLMCELKGRWAEGAGMARSRLMVYETEQLPMPDPRRYSPEERDRIVAAFEALMDREAELGEDASVETTAAERRELNRAVLDPLGLGDRIDEIYDGVERMVRMREQAAGEDTDVLVTRPDDAAEVVELAGVERATESTTLEDF